MDNIYFYVFCIVAIIIGISLIKKFVGCMIRSAIFLIIIAAIAFVYFNYFA